jgi:hypothetical protein
MTDSVDLLKAEIAKEEAALVRDKKALQEMDKNAKRAEAERKRQTKNVCDTVPWALVFSTDRSRNIPYSGSWMRFLKSRAPCPPSSLFSAQKIAKLLWMRYVPP